MSERSETAQHWLRPCPDSAACPKLREQGWRLHISVDDDESCAELVEEQVFPEKVARTDAHSIRATNGRVRLNLAEARWLREQLDEVIPVLEEREREDAAFDETRGIVATGGKP